MLVNWYKNYKAFKSLLVEAKQCVTDIWFKLRNSFTSIRGSEVQSQFFLYVRSSRHDLILSFPCVYVFKQFQIL